MQTNTQAPSKVIAKQQNGDVLSLHSVFYTIQGEGPFSGQPAVFVRLAGCNLQCPGCDTEYTEGARYIAVATLRELFFETRGDNYHCDLVVLTGGEPFRQNVSTFVNSLMRFGIRVQIETNGTLPPSEGLLLDHENLTIVCSPKTGTINPDLAPWIKAYKYVASWSDIADDGLPNHALNHPAKPRLARPVGNGPVYLQPMDEQDLIANKRNMDAVVESCMQFGYTLCLQTHKIVGVE